jgi:hypothetical protein
VNWLKIDGKGLKATLGGGRWPIFTKPTHLWTACTLAQVEQCGVSIYGGSRLVASKGGEGWSHG